MNWIMVTEYPYWPGNSTRQVANTRERAMAPAQLHLHWHTIDFSYRCLCPAASNRDLE